MGGPEKGRFKINNSNCYKITNLFFSVTHKVVTLSSSVAGVSCFVNVTVTPSFGIRIVMWWSTVSIYTVIMCAFLCKRWSISIFIIIVLSASIRLVVTSARVGSSSCNPISHFASIWYCEGYFKFLKFICSNIFAPDHFWFVLNVDLFHWVVLKRATVEQSLEFSRPFSAWTSSLEVPKLLVITAKLPIYFTRPSQIICFERKQVLMKMRFIELLW